MLDTTLPARVSTAREIVRLCVSRTDTMKTLAELTGYSIMTVRKWHSGETMPNPAALRDLCDAVGLEFMMGVVDL